LFVSIATSSAQGELIRVNPFFFLLKRIEFLALGECDVKATREKKKKLASRQCLHTNLM
jgi:hypothetical protein